MFIKQRQVRRSAKFTSRWSRASYRRREYIASLYTTGVIQLFLGVFLLLGAYQSHRLMHTRFPDLVWYGRLALPVLMTALAVVVFRLFKANLGRAIEAYKAPKSSPEP